MTGSIVDRVAEATTSVTCATYNFERSSSLGRRLGAVARSGVDVRLYFDAGTVRRDGARVAAIARSLAPATVLTTTEYAGRPVRSHAKFVIVDHRYVHITSANLSGAGELHNVKLGVAIDDPRLASAMEDQMRAMEDHLYRMVEQ